MKTQTPESVPVAPSKPQRRNANTNKKPDDSAKSGPPTLDEWQDFFARVVVRFACEGYIALAFRGIDDSVMDDKDVDRVKMRKDERDSIAKPYAELANKVPVARKHGRLIVATADSIESTVTLIMWMSRVNRIAKKYRPAKQQRRPRQNVPTRENPANRNGASGGTIPDDRITIINPGG